jgi:NADH-ubiquinone oxidoreductase chain 4
MSFKYKNTLYFKKYKVFLLVLLACLYFSFLSKDFLGFYVFFELSLIPLIILILGWGYQRERIQATFYLFIYTLLGSLPLLLVLIFIHFTLNLLWVNFIYCGSFMSSFFLFFLGGFVILRFFIKLPAFGVHL